MSLKKYVSSITKNQETSGDDKFMKPPPDKTVGIKNGQYDKMNEKGYIPPETPITYGDVIFGKVTPINDTTNSGKIFKDSSEQYKVNADAVVDRVYLGIKNQDGYETRSALIRSERFPHIGDKFCMKFDGTTDVLTSKGWKKIEDITTKDLVATLVDGEKLVYRHPTDVYKFDYNGPMYELRSQQVDLDVTMDHDLYAKKSDHDKFDRYPASELMGKSYNLKKNCKNIYPDVATININGTEYDYDVFLDLLGIFIADGSLDHSNNSRILLAGEKGRKIDHIYEVAKKLGLEVSSSNKKTTALNDYELGCEYSICSSDLYSILKELNVGALNKLPSYVWELSERQARILLNSLVSCDGSHNLQGSECYYTSSKQLADDVMKLCIHCGWAGSIKTLREEGTEYDITSNGRHSTGTLNADTLSVRINKTECEPQINHGHSKSQDGQSERSYHYEGTVGCIQVPSHVFMIRQNNKNVWIGNCCYATGHDVLTTDGWVKVEELTTKHKVACLVGKEKDTLMYINPVAIQEYDYNGEMYEVDSNMVKLLVTPNHRMWVAPRHTRTYRIETAENVANKQRRYKKCVEKYIPDNDVNEHISYDRKFILPGVEDLPEQRLDMKAFLIVLGIWIAEGSMSNDWAVSFAANKKRVQDALVEHCATLGFKIHKHMSKGELVNWCLPEKRLVSFFKTFSEISINKYLPSFVWDLDQIEARWLIDGMMLGDGHRMENGTRRYDTSSAKLADDFQRLCLHAGYSTNIALKCEAGYEAVRVTGEKKGKIIRASVNAWRMTIVESQNYPLVNKDVKKKKCDRMVNYKGKVYCCTVPTDDGVIYVRYKRHPVWCGQSRFGQKGTIGLDLDGPDMPFTRYGIRPDIIMNPNAIPSRMTIGQLWECLVGKVGALKGVNMDATPFEDYDIKVYENMLEALGYQRKGEEYLYNGMTGRKIRNMIFIGPTYYQRLKHMVQDKIHCLTGDHDVLTQDGWTKISEITQEHMIAIPCDCDSDHSDHSGHGNQGGHKYVQPTEVLQYPKKPRNVVLIRYSDGSVMQRITEEHRLYVADTSDSSDALQFNLVPVTVLMDRSTNTLNCRYMIDGNGCVIEGPFRYSVELVDEPVYCLSVYGERFVVRHNSISDNLKSNEQNYNNCGVITGNSRARGPVTILTRQTPEGNGMRRYFLRSIQRPSKC